MNRAFGLIASLALAPCLVGQQQPPPSTETLVLSLKTMSKALATCRDSYTKVLPPYSVPLIQQILGAKDYASDMDTIDQAEKITNALVASPGKITGQFLVLVLSMSDDVYIHATGTQNQLLMGLVTDALDRKSETAKSILLSTSTLGACQTALYNAGDDYVSLVTAYVGAEDAALKKLSK
ncbi:MAG TPA: hypothetical protein VHC90_09480 [Bryobacteraceae bacterium]|nr:hypothetical protein [Bryobacteraceae bacterium]